MASLLETFAIMFDVDSSGAVKGANETTEALDDVEKKTKDVDKSAENLGKSFSDAASSARATFASIVSAAAITAFVKSTSGEADEIGKFSERLGLSVEQVGAWGEAVVRAGGDQASFRSSLESLTSQLQAFAVTGSGALVETLSRLSITPFDADGGLKNAFDLLLDIAGAFEGMDADQSALFGQMLGLDSATILLLQRGRGEVEKAINAQRRLGVVTDEDVRISAEFNDALADLSQTFRDVGRQINREILPPLTDMLALTQEIVQFFGENAESIKNFFIGAAAAIGLRFLPRILSVIKYLRVFLNPITAAVAAMGLLYDALQNQDSIVSKLIDKWPVLGEAIDWVRDKFSDLIDISGGFIDKIFGGNDAENADAARKISMMMAPPSVPIGTPALASRNTSVTIGSLNVDARGGDSQEIANNASNALIEQMQQTVNAYDDGVLA